MIQGRPQINAANKAFCYFKHLTKCLLFKTLNAAFLYRLAILVLLLSGTFLSKSQNPIVEENLKPGNPSSEWDIDGAGDLSIQGFATDLSVNKGERVLFKIKTNAAAYSIDIYRIGYYQGNGARKVGTGLITAILPQSQPTEFRNNALGLVDCGNWSVSAYWDVPVDAVSGIYIARLRRSGATTASHIVFIVRDDASNSDLLFQTSDATWQAYNSYGNNSLYVGNTSYPDGHAVKVSYNRPFLTRSGGGGGGPYEDWLFNAEYPMIRWLERNGYNVTYTTNIDTDRRGHLIKNHKVFMSVGHDEYWSAQQRANVEAARDAGVHLAFFSGNEVYWKTRWEPSIDGSNTSYRTLVCYKEGPLGERGCGGKCDPLPNVWTGLWRGGCEFSADGCKPENALTGQISWAEGNTSITVPGKYRNFRFWRNTSIANLTTNQTATLSNGTLGYEWDYEQNNGHYPAGRVTFSETTVDGKTHKLSLYRHNSGALVFGAGTVQWSWGLDGVHDRGGSTPDPRIQQATVNLFADMGVQPATLQTGLAAATEVTDRVAPSTVITTPSNGATITGGTSITISGTATEAAGIVAGVEVSVDGGTTWEAASGTTNWTYSWTPSGSGTFTIKTRSVDDIGNLETTSTSTNTIQVSTSTTTPPPPTTTPPAPIDGPGGPVLLITSTSNPFSRYTIEILRAEGFNAFANKDISQVNTTELNNYDVVILGEFPLTVTQVSMLSGWVTNGGTLVAMRPDAQLASLFGITPTSNTLQNRYLLVNTATPQGKGIVNETIQYHGPATLYTLNGASALATLYSSSTTATSNPAITIRGVGSNGGQAIAFAYDLAKSVVYSRQGNPAWAGQKRDGQDGPIRSNDMYYGNASFDPQQDWIDLNKVSIPQADEQQRLLTNIIMNGNEDKKPLPRFWFLPRGLKAAIVMTGDDHGSGGTFGRFEAYKSLSPSNTADAVADWRAIRGSSYIYPNTPISNNQAQSLQADGFEIGLHLNTNCGNFTSSTLQNFLNTQLSQFSATFPGVSTIRTNRTHCIAWSDWATKAKLESAKGIRLDVNYYYWPGEWIQNRPGMFTGSGMPMRFADLDGSIIDCYQVTTQMTDESDQIYPGFIDAMLDKALGTEGYYGVFCANMHTDNPVSTGSDAIVSSALERNIPVISANQMLTWLDARNASTYNSLAWNNNTLTFTLTAAQGARNLEVMLPYNYGTVRLKTVSVNGSALTFRKEAIKGLTYAFLSAVTGNYSAVYEVDPCTAPPTATLNAIVDCSTQSIKLKLGSATGSAPYSIVVNNTTYSGVNVGQEFAAVQAAAEQSIWGNTTLPQTTDYNDGQPIEVGVVFRALQDGKIAGIRFYKGPNNTGTHVGSLWTANGTRLASATFINESSSGWQEVRFETPIDITANTVYVASYLSPNGWYAASSGFFGSNITNGSLTALQSGAGLSNGVYRYGGGFPQDSYNSTNYWVDVLFKPKAYNFVLTSITDANSCTNTGAISSAVVTNEDLQSGEQTFYQDNDNDGFGNPAVTQKSCAQPMGFVPQGGDCDDTNANVNPSKTEICNNNIDDNCNGSIDENCSVTFTYYRDADGDGYGDPSVSTTASSQPTGYVLNNTDCNDNDIAVNPGVSEVCGNNKDDNCNGQIDEVPLTTFYRDADGDGFGLNSDIQTGCSAPQGYVAQGGDCNDGDKTIFPSATELCDGKDNDCDGTVDEGCTVRTYYLDNDKDGFGDRTQPLSSTLATPPTGYVITSTDCNDNDNTTYPGAPEICDGKSNDCDSQIDEGLLKTFYRDADGDTYGNPAIIIRVCSQPAGYVIRARDCNDNDNTIYPGAGEKCDGIDNDCDGLIDEGIKRVYYNDADGDTYGNPAITITACSQPAGYVIRARDCNDNDNTIYPGAVELCDGKNNDCDSRTDEGCIVVSNGVKGAAKSESKADTISNSLSTQQLKVTVIPNPSPTYFNLLIQSPEDKPVTIRIIDGIGRQVEVKQGVTANGTVQIGSTYRPGVYHAEVKQGNTTVTVKLLKLIE